MVYYLEAGLLPRIEGVTEELTPSRTFVFLYADTTNSEDRTICARYVFMYTWLKDAKRDQTCVDSNIYSSTPTLHLSPSPQNLCPHNRRLVPMRHPAIPPAHRPYPSIPSPHEPPGLGLVVEADDPATYSPC